MIKKPQLRAHVVLHWFLYQGKLLHFLGFIQAFLSFLRFGLCTMFLAFSYDFCDSKLSYFGGTELPFFENSGFRVGNLKLGLILWSFHV